LLDTQRVILTIAGANSIFGLRRRIYSLAATFYALVQDNIPLITYDEEDLKATLYFGTLERAVGFENGLYQIQDEMPCLSHLSIDVSVKPSALPSSSHYLRLREYNPADHGSPPSLSSSTDSPLQQEDYIQFQSIEDPSSFQDYRGEHLHIISRVDCIGPLRAIAKSPNNHLYAHRNPFHQFFDGLGTVPRIPLILILPYQVLDTPPRRDSNEDLRRDVEIELFFFKDSVRTVCLNNLRQPYRRSSEFDTAIITVGVLDPSIFVQCLNYRALQTIPIWKNRRDCPLLPSSLRIEYNPTVLGLTNRSIRDFRLPVCFHSPVLPFWLLFRVLLSA
jgi:hypothetical protein